MANVELSIKALVDVVEHLVRSNVRWNQDLTHDEALAKVEAARLHAVAADAVKVTSDVQNAVNDAGAGNVAGVVGDVQNAVADVKETATDSVSMVKSNE